MTGKKWMIVLTEEQVEWLKSTAEHSNLSGSAVAREAISWVMKDRDFVPQLASVQYKLELQELEQRRAEIAEKETELKRRMKQEKVAI